MRALLQRVSEARVTSNGRVLGEIGKGLLILLGVSEDDDAQTARALAAKSVKLRIFPDEQGKMNRSVADVGGAVMVVSQFTLYADARSGNRPSFIAAARGELAQPLCDEFSRAVAESGITVASGEFGANMQVALVNDGPVTIWLDSDELVRKGPANEGQVNREQSGKGQSSKGQSNESQSSEGQPNKGRSGDQTVRES